jgi:mRNA-degrading endonuclease toxin of MazEF toxin-antitoxin module
VIPRTGEIWLADLGAATRRPVYVISDDRFHRLAERAIVAPVLSAGAGHDPPWWIESESSVVAVERLSSIPLERLLERHGTAAYRTVRAVQRTIGMLAGLDR